MSHQSKISQANASILKRCTKCGDMKELKSFGPCKQTASGLRHQCRVCVLVYYRGWIARRRAKMAAWLVENGLPARSPGIRLVVGDAK